MTVKKVNIFKDTATQILAAVTGTLVAASDGMSFGWTSPMVPYLLSHDSHIFTTEKQAEWLETISLLGAFCGLPFTIYFVDKIGRKKSLLLAAIVVLLNWIAIGLADRIEYIFVARFFSGMAGDMSFVAAPMYIAEIADSKVRGFLSSIIYIMMLIGLILVYSLGPFAPFYAIPVAGIVLASVQLLVFSFQPESPYYLVYKNRFFKKTMASLVRWYDNFMQEHQDEHTKNWFLVGDLGTLLLILASYVYFCTKIGPRLMKDRKPFKLTRPIQIYNIFQVMANAYLVYEGIQSGWFTTYDFKCEPVDYSGSPIAMRMRKAVWCYFIIKLTDLMDTVFFVLRKKYNQVTFLHVYHHTLMPICSFIGITFVPGGHGSLLGICNAFVHIVLYAYYFLASLGPEVQKYLWWKKHVTKLQLVQFLIILIHNVQVLPRDCNYPKVFNLLLSIQAGYFIYLFGSFYVRAYIEKKPQRTIIKDTKKVEENGNTIIANGDGYVNVLSNGYANSKVKAN